MERKSTDEKSSNGELQSDGSDRIIDCYLATFNNDKLISSPSRIDYNGSPLEFSLSFVPPNGVQLVCSSGDATPNRQVRAIVSLFCTCNGAMNTLLSSMQPPPFSAKFYRFVPSEVKFVFESREVTKTLCSIPDIGTSPVDDLNIWARITIKKSRVGSVSRLLQVCKLSVARIQTSSHIASLPLPLPPLSTDVSGRVKSKASTGGVNPRIRPHAKLPTVCNSHIQFGETRNRCL